MTRDSWWLAISIVWLFVLLGALLLFASHSRRGVL